VTADVQETNGNAAFSERSDQSFQLSRQLLLRRWTRSGQVELFDPQQPDAVGAVVECEFHVIGNADVRLDFDPLPVQRIRWLMTRRLAAHECRPPRGDALLEFCLRGLSWRDDQRAPEAVHQEFRTSADAR